MTPVRGFPGPRCGSLAVEVLGACAALTLLGGLVVFAAGAVRQQHATESSAARLEEAQNLGARWRAGGPVPNVPGWTVDVHQEAGAEILVLRASGVRLATLRRAP